MNKDIKKVFIAGGTGFLGYYSALEFIRKGIEVDTISLPDIPLAGWFPAKEEGSKEDQTKKIGVKYGNLFTMPKEELVEILRGYDAIIYSVGPDDRVHSPKGETAYDFFYSRLVTSVVKVFEAAIEAGVKKGILLNSYFSYFDRVGVNSKVTPGKLAERNPYVKVRVAQAKALMDLGGGIANGGKMDVVSLELPYIFGNMPERMPLWKDIFLDRFVKLPAMFFPKGGTIMIHVTGIAEGVVAATLNAEHGDKLPIGADNKKFKFMNDEMMKYIGAPKRTITLPTWMTVLGGMAVQFGCWRKGEGTGLNYCRLMQDIQSQDLYLDPKPIQEKLGYAELGYNGGVSIDEGIKETMQACYPHRFDEKGELIKKWIGLNPSQFEPFDNDPELSVEERKANKKRLLAELKAKKKH